jgi:hypothetical protein
VRISSIVGLGGVLVAAVASAAAAAPPTATRVTGALPAGVKPSAALAQAWTFVDGRGTDYVLLSAKNVTGEATRSAYLYVDLWVLPAGGKPKLVRTVRDAVEDCDADAEARFHDDAFGVTDLDADGVAEVTFGYETGCRSDASPNAYKLLLLTGTDKYILRGTTIVRDPGDGHGNQGGRFTPDPDARRWPRGAFAHARALWARTAADLVVPPTRATREE